MVVPIDAIREVGRPCFSGMGTAKGRHIIDLDQAIAQLDPAHQFEFFRRRVEQFQFASQLFGQTVKVNFGPIGRNILHQFAQIPAILPRVTSENEDFAQMAKNEAKKIQMEMEKYLNNI